MVKIDNNEIYITRGDSGSIDLAIEKDGESYDYSGDDVFLSVKKSPCDLNTLIKKAPVNGKFVFSPADTVNLPFGTYYYDIVLITADGAVTTVIEPKPFTIGEEVHKV